MNLSTINFRSLESSDLENLQKWLNTEHVQQHYQKSSISLPEVLTKYLPRLESAHPTHCHIAEFCGVSIGKFQSYRISDYEEFANEIGFKKGVSIDFFIGEQKYLGRGLGKELLRCYIIDVVKKLFPEEKSAYICHDETNVSAIKCSLGAGFKVITNVIEDGKPSVLLSLKL